MTAQATAVPAEIEEREIEVAEAGRWRRVPALAAGNTIVFLRGRRLRTAVIWDEDFAAAAAEAPERWVATLRRRRINGRKADLFTFSQRLPDAERRFPYPFGLVSIAALKLGTFDEWWKGLPQETRKNVRRAERRGVEVRVQRLDDGLVRGIQGVNNECPLVQGKKARFYGKSLAEVAKDQASFPERSWFVCAYHQGELIGYMKIVRCGGFGSVLGTLTRPSHADKRPANAILARAVRLCTDEGLEYLVYGQLNYGNKKEGSLREFKLRNGFAEFLVPRYYVPLTLRGRLALRMGLHKGLLGILPPWAIQFALWGRSWLRRRTTGQRRDAAVRRESAPVADGGA
ncbi:MAG: GNAT family N-acetyltransferase [Terriglobales bacterium]